MNLQEIKTDLEKGVLYSRVAFTQMLDRAILLETQRNTLAHTINEQLAPESPDPGACRTCTLESSDSTELWHSADCPWRLANDIVTKVST